MSAWDFEGEFTWDEDEGAESEQAKSVLNRWRILNLMRPPGMTHAFYRILSVIAQHIPPGKELWKGRRQLAEEADVSLRVMVKFYKWAYEKEVNLMGRKKGRRGFSDRVRPNYRAWVDHAVPTVQRMTDVEKQAKAAGYLEAFALAIGKDGMWVRRFRQSLGSVESSLPSEQSAQPQGRKFTTASEGSTPPLVNKVHTRSEVVNRSSNKTEKQVLENGSTIEQAQGRASHFCFLSGKDETQKSTAREEPTAVERIAEYLCVVPQPSWDRHKAILNRQGYSYQDIEQGEQVAWEWIANGRDVQTAKRCRGLTMDKSACVVKVEPGSDFCFRHQGQERTAK